MKLYIMDNRSIDKFDLRLRKQFIENESLSVKEIDTYIESLEDQSDNIEEIIIEEKKESAE